MNTDKRRTFRLISIIPLFLCVVLLLSLSACATLDSRPTNVKVLIVPKFEIDEMSGDFPGEALSGENIDIFETGMQNLFDVASVAIDALLNK